MKNKIIYYDASFSIGKFRGMGKYINNFLKAFDDFKDVKIIGLLPSKKKSTDNFDNYISFGFRNYILWEQISLLNFILKKRNNNDIFIFPYNTAPIFINPNNNNILIIHDIIFMNNYKSKSLKQLIGNAYRKFVLPLVINKFKYIVTVSEYSKSQIINYFHLPDSRIVVFPNSINFNNTLFLYNLNFENKKPFFFHIGGEPDYKNTYTVVKAYSLLPDAIRGLYKLRIVGIRDINVLTFYNNILLDLKLTNSIEFLPFITDEEIEYNFINAKLFIFPSKEEGFGIPIIESMKFGCPLICSNSSCIPEIAGDAAYYFDPNSHLDLADKIIELLTNHTETEKKILTGYDILKKYNSNNVKENVSSWLRATLQF